MQPGNTLCDKKKKKKKKITLFVLIIYEDNVEIEIWELEIYLLLQWTLKRENTLCNKRKKENNFIRVKKYTEITKKLEFDSLRFIYYYNKQEK